MPAIANNVRPLILPLTAIGAKQAWPLDILRRFSD
jgi:hypothetical protein